MPGIVYLNGKFVPEDKALVAYNDRGFQFADGAYEVIKFYKGKPFRFDGHLKRLERSLTELKIRFDDIGKVEEICTALIEKNSLGNAYAGVYIQVTRGSHSRMHTFPANISPTVCINACLMNPGKKSLLEGITAISGPDIRWTRCDIKSVSLLPNVLMMQEAATQNAGECIFIRDRIVTEASRSNVLGVKSGKIFTHPDNNFILAGITKGAVKDICSENNIDFVEEPVKAEELYRLDELIATGTGSEITPVLAVDNKMIGNGKPGPVTRIIQNCFFEMTYLRLAGDKWWNF